MIPDKIHQVLNKIDEAAYYQQKSYAELKAAINLLDDEDRELIEKYMEFINSYELLKIPLMDKYNV
jgi:hypothetical protein